MAENLGLVFGRLAVSAVVVILAALSLAQGITPVGAQVLEGSLLVVAAAGDTGDEILAVRSGETVFDQFTVSTSIERYEVVVPAGVELAELEIAFINDLYEPPYDRDLIVDYAVSYTHLTLPTIYSV